MQYKYETENTCANEITFEIEGNTVKNISFSGGCNGNLKAIPLLVEGRTVDQIEEKLKGITCGRRPTSCCDQLAKATREAYEKARVAV